MYDDYEPVLMVTLRDDKSYMVNAGERKVLDTYPNVDTYYADNSPYEYYYGEQKILFEYIPNGSPLDKDWKKLWWILLRCNWKMRIVQFKRRISHVFNLERSTL